MEIGWGPSNTRVLLSAYVTGGAQPILPIYHNITGNEWGLKERFALSLQNLGAPVVNAK